MYSPTFDFGAIQIAPEALAQLVLVANPVQHPQGDFALLDGRVQEHGGTRWTYSGIGLYRPELFEGCSPGDFRCCRCCGARWLHGGCMASYSKAPGATSAASNGWPRLQ